MTNFGPVIHPVMVDNAVIAHLKLWLPTHLHQMEREQGIPVGSYLQLPPNDHCYSNVYDESQYVDKRLPAILVITGGATVERHGTGTYTALWDVLISAVVRSINGSDVRLVASLYGAAVWRCMMQHAELGGFADGVVWGGPMPLVPLSETVDRTGKRLLVAQSRWSVYVNDIVSDRDGPVNPDPLPDPTTPYPPDSIVEETDVDVIGLPLP